MTKQQSSSLELKTTNGTKFKPHLAAVTLVEAAYRGDDEAAERWGVTTRTIMNWRARLDEDVEFSAIFAHKKEQFEAGWRDELGLALRAGIDFLKRAAQEADPRKADVIFSVAGAVKILADVNASMDILDARLTEFNRQTRETDRALAAEAETNEINRDPFAVR